MRNEHKMILAKYSFPIALTFVLQWVSLTVFVDKVCRTSQVGSEIAIHKIYVHITWWSSRLVVQSMCYLVPCTPSIFDHRRCAVISTSPSCLVKCIDVLYPIIGLVTSHHSILQNILLFINPFESEPNQILS